VQHGRGEMAGIPSCRGGGLASELFVRGLRARVERAG